MPALGADYGVLLLASTAFAALTVLQILVADGFALFNRHIPGTPVAGGHRDLLFRVTRAHANTLENLGLYVLLLLLLLASAADARWAGILAWTFVGARVAHMLCYYADWRIARSGVFTVGLLAQIGMLVLVGMAVFSQT